MKQIIVHMNGTHNSVGYETGVNLFERGIPFETCCTRFFSNDFFKNDFDIIAKWDNGEFITVSRVMSNDGFHTCRAVRNAHNLERMLLASAFRNEKPGFDKREICR